MKTKASQRKAANKWKKNNRDKVKFIKIREKYGLSKEDYTSMIEQQNKRCKLCESKVNLVVDHCHKTSKVRGLLCSSCNKALGFFKDNIEVIKKAVIYLTA